MEFVGLLVCLFVGLDAFVTCFCVVSFGGFWVIWAWFGFALLVLIIYCWLVWDYLIVVCLTDCDL